MAGAWVGGDDGETGRRIGGRVGDGGCGGCGGGGGPIYSPSDFKNGTFTLTRPAPSLPLTHLSIIPIKDSPLNIYKPIETPNAQPGGPIAPELTGRILS